METLLRKVAERSNHPDYKHAAIVFEGNRVLAHAANLDAKHAEERALRKVSEGGKKRVLLSCRTDAKGALKMARPCEKCMVSIRRAGVSVVKYTNEKGEWVEFNVDG